MMIKSILDNDLYKFSMMAAVLELFPNAKVEYKFKNRGKQKFNEEFLNLLKNEIQNLKNLKLTNEEYDWLKNNIPYFKPSYLAYLKNYRFDLSQVEINLTKDNDLDISIKGFWRDTILFEVVIMALISEIYFRYIDTNWIKKGPNGMDGLDWVNIGQRTLAYEKIEELSKNECNFAEFGTRRRRSHEIQDLVINQFVEYGKNNTNSTFVGTSNVYFAKKYNIKAIGTYAHEWVQGMQALESINHCNYFAMQNWVKVYNTELGVCLPDCIATDMFLQNFNRRFAMLFSGLRHDSGNAFEFADKIINHYKKLNIDPMSKFIIFSDGLSIEKAIEINKYCKEKIKCSFGIGTSFTNDISNSPSLNMVIKLWSVNRFPVVKVPDTEGKSNGDPKAVEVMKYIIKNQLKN